MPKIHHLNCATMCPYGGRLVSGEGGLFTPAKMVCHCLLVETAGGLVLVDSGIGTAECRDPHRFDAGFRAIARPRLDLAETAIEQVKRLGFRPQDVRHIVVTHLDLDHAGGLPDFPWATVHLHAKEHAAAMARATLAEKNRYVPAHWAHGPTWRTYADEGDAWHGLQAIRLLDGLDGIALVPLFGHTRGHSGVAVQDGASWWLHAGDAYFHRGELESPVRCPSGLGFFEAAVQIDKAARIANRDRLGVLARENAGTIRVFSAHDPVELARTVS